MSYAGLLAGDKPRSLVQRVLIAHACPSLSLTSVRFVLDGHRRSSPEGPCAQLLVERTLSLIIANLGICLNCRVRTKEITIKVILFEYSRTS